MTVRPSYDHLQCGLPKYSIDPRSQFIKAITDSEIMIAPVKKFMAATQGHLHRVAFRRKIRKENHEEEFLKFQARER